METGIAWLLLQVMPMILLVSGAAAIFAQPELLLVSDPLIRISSRGVIDGGENLRNAFQSGTQKAGG